MVKVMVDLIIGKRITINDIPEKHKQAVVDELLKRGYIIKEEEKEEKENEESLI